MAGTQLELLAEVDPGRPFDERPPLRVPPLTLDKQESDRCRRGSHG